MDLLTDEEEMGRLKALDRCAIVDTAPEVAFNDLVALVTYTCNTPIAFIGFIDDRREWFKARIGFNHSELPLNQSLDTRLLTHPQPLIIADTLADPRFSSRSLLFGEAPIRFYASVPIVSPDGFVLGALAIADYAPRDLTPQQREVLSNLARQIDGLIELRTMRHLAAAGHRHSFLAELGRRAIYGVPIADLMKWTVRQIPQVLNVNRCCILELLPNHEALPRASYGWGFEAPDNPMPLAHFALGAYTLEVGQPIVIDTTACENKVAGDELLRAHGIKSGICLIIPGSPRSYGLLSAYSDQGRSFAPEDVAFLQEVADLLGRAISQRWHQQNLESIINLSRILGRAATRLEMKTIILTHIHTVCQSEGAAIILRNADGHAFVAQGHGIWADVTGRLLPDGSGSSWQVMQSGQPLIDNTPDFLPEHTRFRADAVACVALKFNEQPLGVLWVAYPSAISYADQRLLVALADVVASAINRSDLHDQTVRLYHEHQQLTKEVRRAERHLASTVESAMDLVVSTDTDGRIKTWNRAAERISGFSRDQMIGKYLRDLCAPAHQIHMDEMIKSIITGASSGQVEIPLIGATGQDVPVSWRLAAIQSDTGESSGIVAIGRDLVEQRYLETQLFQAAKMASMGVMASGIGHELRNPLGIISANAQLAQEHLSDQELIRTCIQQIYGATKRAALIIDNLLTFALPRNEMSQLVDLNEVLAATFMLLDYQIQQHRVALVATLAHPIPSVAGNAALLQQVFTNLILNALQAMEGGGTLEVTTRTSAESGVEVLVSDTGSGILPDVLPQIFDPFFTTRPIGQGTGLGLAISYSIIQQHGGTIEAFSPPEAGSTFCIRLPAAPAS